MPVFLSSTVPASAPAVSFGDWRQHRGADLVLLLDSGLNCCHPEGYTLSYSCPRSELVSRS